MSDYLTLHKRTEAEARAERYGALLLSSLRAYFDQLSAHDWNMKYCDDYDHFKALCAERDQLHQDSTLSDEHRKLWLAFLKDGKWWRVQERHWPEGVLAKPERP